MIEELLWWTTALKTARAGRASSEQLRVYAHDARSSFDTRIAP